MKKRMLYFVSAIIMTMIFAANMSVSEAAETGAKIFTGKDSQNSKELYKEGEALVLYKNGAVSSKKAALNALSIKDSVRVEKFWQFETPDSSDNQSEIRTMSNTQDISIGLVTSKTMSTKQLIAKLKKDDNVEIAEPNYRLQAEQTDDTYFSKQWALENIGQNGGTAGSSTNISSKWGNTTGSDEVVVAVVDTGVDYTHEDLKDNIWENPYQPSLKGDHGFDFSNSDNDPMDDNGHGSHCAGIIGAKGNNETGISGVNQNVKIMALKILDDEGSGYGTEEISAYHYINKALNLGVNVVAINNSWGGGEPSEIFEKLINLVGEKGAVTVCAAGNDGENKDSEEASEDYPTDYASAYKINVAATNEKNELASFSNYGKDSVDIAAPGADILSTVSYDCYNPSLYNMDKQTVLSQKFNDFEGNVPAELEWNIVQDNFFNCDEKKDTSNYKEEIVGDEYFGETGGNSLKLSFGTLNSEESAGVRIPYTVSGEKKSPWFSAMVRANGPADESGRRGVFLIADVPAGTKFSSGTDGFLELMDYPCAGVYVSGESDDWTHLMMECADLQEHPGKDRELVIVFIAGAKGEYNVYLDDIGLSSEDVEPSEFGKYDFYSGTSMAAPHVTGAVALEAAMNSKSTVEELIDNVLCCVKEEENLSDKVMTGGTLDFSKKAASGPRIGDISVDVNKNQILVKGTGFDAGDLEAKVICNGKEVTADIVKKSKSSLILADKGWINRIVTISVTGNRKKNTKKDIYLVKGKPSYTAVKDFEFMDSDIMATDGRQIYSASSMSDSIDVMDTTDTEYMDFETVFSVEPEKYFKKDSSSLGEYDFTFGKDLVYMDGKLYNVVAYSEVAPDNSWDDDDDEDWSVKKEKDEEEKENGEGSGGSSGGVAYSSQYKLMCFDPASETIQDLGALPADLKQTEDWTLAGYNGNLYLIGGYDYKAKSCSKTVKIYTPSNKKWTNGPALPEGRAGGRTVQNGNSLIYTLGYSAASKDKDVKDQSCPANLILKGNQWQTSKKSIHPYIVRKTVTYSGHVYNVYDANAGLCAEGIIYSGVPVEGLGDTFIYNVNRDEYQAMKYGQITDLSGTGRFTGIAVGNTLYGFNERGESYKAGINSGLVKVSAKKMSKGKIVNANTGFMPGMAVKLTVKPKKGYAVKTFKVDGKKMKGRSTTVRLTSNIKASASFGKAVSKIQLNKKKVTLKAGKTFKLKAKITPKNAVSKKVIYKSSNKKYATVSKKGVIKAKKAGKGKTVTITVKSTDGSNKKAKCKVKIK